MTTRVTTSFNISSDGKVESSTDSTYTKVPVPVTESVPVPEEITQEKVDQLKELFKKSHPDHDLVLVGAEESILKDLECSDAGGNFNQFKKDSFIKIAKDEKVWTSLTKEERKMVWDINMVVGDPSRFYNALDNGQCGWLGLHELALLPNNDGVAEELQSLEYGLGQAYGLRVYFSCSYALCNL